MAYVRIPDLPFGGNPTQNIDVNNDLMVLEQDITRKLTPLTFLEYSIPNLQNINTVDPTNSIPVSDSQITKNLTIQNLLDYFKKHWTIINEVFYVSNGDNASDVDDTPERGRNEELPYASIKKAAQAIVLAQQSESNQNATDANYNSPTSNIFPSKKQYTIMVRSGDYKEQNPIYLPPNTSLIGDNLRRTTVRPANPYYDMFWVSSACYIWGFTFRGHKNQVTPRSTSTWDPSEGQFTGIGSAVVAFPICTDICYGNNGANLDGYLRSLGIAYNSNVNSYYQQYKNWIQQSVDIAYRKADGSLTTYDATGVIPNKRPVIYVSPYIQGCTSYAVSSDITPIGQSNPAIGSGIYYVDRDRHPWGDTSSFPSVSAEQPPFSNNLKYINYADWYNNTSENDAGTGMRIDGSLVDGRIRSMVLDSFTQVNQGGRGIHLLNHGYAQLVSIFTVGTKEGILAEAGGSCSISTSNSTFGLSGLVARGKSVVPVLSGRFRVAPTNSPTDSYGYYPTGNRFTISDVTPLPIFQYGDGSTAQYVVNAPYTNLCFTVGMTANYLSNFPQSWTNIKTQTTISSNIIQESDIDLRNGRPIIKYFTIDTTPARNISDAALTAAYDITLSQNIFPDFSVYDGAPVYFYARSMVETGSHTFEFMGTGTRMLCAIPMQGGVADNSKECVFDGLYDTNEPGIVFFTSSNEIGNFKVGPGFTIVQATGIIEGDVFNRAILTLVTPLNLVLE